MSTIHTMQAEDYSPYLQKLNEAKKKKNKAALQAAYENSLSAIKAEESGLEERYRKDKNTAAGASAREGRNFAQYAAANGLGNGAAGQAALARSVTLQNNLNDLTAQKATKQSQLALQRADAKGEYENGLAEADAEAEEELAQALYEESVRRNQAQYQASRDAVKDEQWRKEQDYKASRDAAQDEQWRRELEFAIQKYWYDNGYLTPPVTSGGTGASGTPNTDLQSVAMQVIRGDWGNGAARRQKLTAAGYDYAAVQALVDAILAGK